jgi:tetratricopeptide (TPR) repeat protein
LLGAWEFEEAFGVAGLCGLAAAYLRFASRKSAPPIPDPATLLDRAIEFASAGRSDRAVALLTKTIRLSPRLWQAFQYRGELYLAQPGSAAAALADFDAAVRLAPAEPRLYVLRAQAHAVLGDHDASRRDFGTAATLVTAPGQPIGGGVRQ